MKLPPLAATSLLLFSFLAAGCGPKLVPVTGIAARQGKPVTHLSLIFAPLQGRPLWGATDDQGRFELHFEQGQKGVPLGTYKVSVNFQPRTAQEEFDIMSGKLQYHPDKDLILQKYGNPSTTSLVVQITHANQEIQLNLD